MKNPKAFSLIIWFVFLTVIAVCTSCKSVQTPVVETLKTVEKNNLTDTTKILVNRNKAIVDSLKIVIGKYKTAKPDCDSITNAAITDVLSRINSNKSSGDNRLGFYYDKLNQTLVAYGQIAETLESIKSSKSVQKEYYNINHTKPIIVEAQFTKEQTFNLWVGRIFWLGLIAFVIWRLKSAVV